MARIKVKTWPKGPWLKLSRKFLGWGIYKSSNICGTITQCFSQDIYTPNTFHIYRDGNQGLLEERHRAWIPQLDDGLTGTLSGASLFGILMVLRQENKRLWRLIYERPQQWKGWELLILLNCTKPWEHAQSKNLLWVHKKSLHPSFQSPFVYWALWAKPQWIDTEHFWALLYSS